MNQLSEVSQVFSDSSQNVEPGGYAERGGFVFNMNQNFEDIIFENETGINILQNKITSIDEK